MSEVGEGGSDCGSIIEYWTVVDIVRCPIETLVGAPLQKGILIYGPSCVEDWREEGVYGGRVV